MRQTLFTVPYELFGVPIFGVGVLLAVWIAVAAVIVVRSARREGLNQALGNLPLLLIVGAVIYLLPSLFPDGLPIRGYGVMMLLGVLAGVGLAIHRARRAKVDPELIVALAFWLFVAGIVGARAFYVIEYWPTFQRPTLAETVLAIVNVSQGGLVVYGSLLGAAAAYVVFVSRRRVPALALADLIAPSMVLGLALGRIGCLLNGCCYGGPSDVPWAVTFPWGSPPHVNQVTSAPPKLALHGMRFDGPADARPIVAEVVAGSQAEAAGLQPGQWITHVNQRSVLTIGEVQHLLLGIYGEGTTLSIRTESSPDVYEWTLGPPPRSLPVHPTQIYAALNAALIFAVLLAWNRRRRRDGELIALLLTIYPVTRFILESIRTDEPPILWGMTISQSVSVVILVGAAALWIYILRRPAGLTWPEYKA